MQYKPKRVTISEAGDKWVQDAEKNKKWEPGKDFFKDNSAEKIASGAKSGHDGDEGAAIKALTFAKNRNSSIGADIKGKIDKAIEILQKQNKESFKTPRAGKRYEYINPGHSPLRVEVKGYRGRAVVCEALEDLPDEGIGAGDELTIQPDAIGEGFKAEDDDESLGSLMSFQ